MKKLLVFSSVVLFISLGIIFFYGCGKTPEKSLLSSNVGGSSSGVSINGVNFTVNTKDFEFVNEEPPTLTGSSSVPNITKIEGDKSITPGVKQKLTVYWVDSSGSRPNIGCFPTSRSKYPQKKPKVNRGWWRWKGSKDGKTSGTTEIEYTFSGTPNSDTEIVVSSYNISDTGTALGGTGTFVPASPIDLSGNWSGSYSAVVGGKCNTSGSLSLKLSQSDIRITGSASMSVQALRSTDCSVIQTVTLKDMVVSATVSGWTITGTITISGQHIYITATLSGNDLNGNINTSTGSGTFTLTR